MRRFWLLLLFLSSLSLIDGLFAGDPCHCDTFDYFRFYLRRQCPVITDLRCAFLLPGDIIYAGQLNCATVDDYPHPRLHHIDAGEMLRLVNHRDTYGRAWCMLSLLYSPDCVFSAKAAASVYKVAKYFPKLKVVAVDVTGSVHGSDSKSKLISQLGVTSTPVVALWQNGYAMFRLYDDYSNVESLVKVIMTKTDLQAQRHAEDEAKKLIDSDESVTEKLTKESPLPSELFPNREEFLELFPYLKNDIGFDWYFLWASIALAINSAYFILQSIAVQDYVRRLLPS